ncbi:hypothetical protein E2C01_070410 [Portunus trituberculatus]|uniref:Uncharacterized protein n=1 Tax=Portunus trituberculatus TaxID=210409 RepID=A0A5B7I272_PORTR|nr:hypothetical protein [Portunus trituberculatus]
MAAPLPSTTSATTPGEGFMEEVRGVGESRDLILAAPRCTAALSDLDGVMCGLEPELIQVQHRGDGQFRASKMASGEVSLSQGPLLPPLRRLPRRPPLFPSSLLLTTLASLKRYASH